MTFADSLPLISPSSPKPGIKISSGERIVTVILGHHRKPGDECIKTLNLDWPCVPCAKTPNFLSQGSTFYALIAAGKFLNLLSGSHPSPGFSSTSIDGRSRGSTVFEVESFTRQHRVRWSFTRQQVPASTRWSSFTRLGTAFDVGRHRKKI